MQPSAPARSGDGQVLVRGWLVNGLGDPLDHVAVSATAPGPAGLAAPLRVLRHHSGGFEVLGTTTAARVRLRAPWRDRDVTTDAAVGSRRFEFILPGAGRVQTTLRHDPGFRASTFSVELWPDDQAKARIMLRVAGNPSHAEHLYRGNQVPIGTYTLRVGLVEGSGPPLVALDRICVEQNAMCTDPRLRCLDVRGRCRRLRVDLRCSNGGFLAPGCAEGTPVALGCGIDLDVDVLAPDGSVIEHTSGGWLRNQLMLLTSHPYLNVRLRLGLGPPVHLPYLRTDTVVTLEPE